MINKDKLKGFLAGVSLAVVLCSTTAFADNISKTVTAVYNNIKIMINGEEIVPRDANGNIVEPFIIDGTTYLPVRAIATALGQEVNWDGNTNSVYIGKLPDWKDGFHIDSDTLKPFSKKELLSINSTPVNGGIFNFYITNDAIDEYMRYSCDNYSPFGTLQTLTIESVPAAKFHTEQARENIKFIYSVCDDAQKTGFAKKADVIKAVDEEWESYIGQMGGKEALSDFAAKCSITLNDLEILARKTFLSTLYIEKMYESKLEETYDMEEYIENLSKNFITAKHILVKDEALAKEIIRRLNKGENFDALMKEHNIDSRATESGYTFTYGEMVEPFEKASFSLDENTYTKEPVKSEFGYHIIYRLPVNETELSNAVDNQIRVLATEATNKYFTELSEKASVTYTSEYERYITTIK